MAEPIDPNRMMMCGGEDVDVVVEWERGRSVIDLLDSTF